MRSGFPLQTSPPFILNLSKKKVLIKFMRSWCVEEAEDKCMKAGDTIPAAVLGGGRGTHSGSEALIE